jgi:sugar (pentulose or hexulose) kinase
LGAGVTIVVDIGKTLAKLTLWSRDGQCLARMTRANERAADSLDADGIADWLIDSLKQFADHPVEAIIPVAHGAGVAGIIEGHLAFAPPDYEAALTDEALASYRAQRDPFAQTGSPALPQGLNLGALLHALGSTIGTATLMPWAQYWAWFLSGVATSEVTSLGCHSDLWAPAEGDFAPMAKRRGWAAQFAPIARAGDVIGALRPDIARRTGLSPQVRVHCGLHDSNAALIAARGFPEIANREATVLSTGTWFVAMRTPATPFDLATLPEGRDCLINVDAFGTPIPSARFMGGREIETLIELDTRRVDIRPDQPALLAAVDNVIASGALVLPTLAPGCGPFPDGESRWVARPDDWFARRSAACLYAALVTETALSLIGTSETLLIEGRFADAEVFVRALASLRPDLAVYTANAHSDVSFGALRLIDPALIPAGGATRVKPLDQSINDYAARWREAVQ